VAQQKQSKLILKQPGQEGQRATQSGRKAHLPRQLAHFLFAEGEICELSFRSFASFISFASSPVLL